MGISEEQKKNILDQNQYKKVSGKLKKLISIVNKFPVEQRSRIEAYEDLLMDREFIFSVFAEVKGLNEDERDTLIKEELL